MWTVLWLVLLYSCIPPEEQVERRIIEGRKEERGEQGKKRQLVLRRPKSPMNGLNFSHWNVWKTSAHHWLGAYLVHRGALSNLSPAFFTCWIPVRLSPALFRPSFSFSLFLLSSGDWIQFLLWYIYTFNSSRQKLTSQTALDQETPFPTFPQTV